MLSLISHSYCIVIGKSVVRLSIMKINHEQFALAMVQILYFIVGSKSN